MSALLGIARWTLWSHHRWFRDLYPRLKTWCLPTKTRCAPAAARP